MVKYLALTLDPQNLTLPPEVTWNDLKVKEIWMSPDLWRATSPYDQVISSEPHPGWRGIFLIYQADQEIELSSLKFQRRGSRRAGNARYVWQWIEDPFFFGLTVHPTQGSWSSWPPHKFETEALVTPALLYPDFYEQFLVFTNPPGGWGLIAFASAYDLVQRVVAWHDGQAIDIPLGSHPIVAAPGYQLAYFWAYCGGGDKFNEKGEAK